jgi:hypothetical protein
MRTKTLLLLSAIALTSCDPGIAVVISNKSKTDKNVRVIYPPDFKFPADGKIGINDSVETIDESDYTKAGERFSNTVRVPILSMDTAARTYSFDLKAGHRVAIESRWPAGSPTYGQRVIIDNTDTVELRKEGKEFRKKPKLVLGGSWIYTISDPGESLR